MSARNQALVEAMAARGVNCRELARTLKLSPSAVSHWRSGHRTPGQANATRVAELLDRPVEQLWPDLAIKDRDADALAERLARIDRVAAVTGVTRGTVRSWLAGKRRPGMLARAALLANGFTVDCRLRKPSRRSAGSGIRPLTCREALVLPSQYDPKWRERALCASSPDPDLWWPESEGDPGTEAREVCARCPVIASCRDAFLANPWPDRRCVVAGVWGQSLVAERGHRRRKEAA